MEADATGTLETLRRYRAAMATLIERHDGRVVNTWGDAVIAEFPSVVEAVQCAVETQQEISAYNGGLPEPRRMRFRIGIHLGDVMVEGDDVYGDGVNIAARLQELAEPGGILISGPVYDQVHNKLSIGVRLPRPAAPEERRQPGDGLSRSSGRREDAVPAHRGPMPGWSPPRLLARRYRRGMASLRSGTGTEDCRGRAPC